jgi:clan AA aspartic protease
MTGRVNGDGHALLPVILRHPTNGQELSIDAWVDTAFTGDLVLDHAQIASLNLPVDSSGYAVLADGSPLAIKKYSGQIEWFGEPLLVEVIANDCYYPLLGVGLLRGRILHIDYAAGTLTLD